MSTSMLIASMEKAAKAKGVEAVVTAVPVAEFEGMVGDYDVALLGPQVRYQLDSFRVIGAEVGVPVAVIDMVAYGMIDGAKVLDQALELTDQKAGGAE